MTTYKNQENVQSSIPSIQQVYNLSTHSKKPRNCGVEGEMSLLQQSNGVQLIPDSHMAEDKLCDICSV